MEKNVFSEFAESFHLSIKGAQAMGLEGEELSTKALELFQFHCGGLVLYIPKGCSNNSYRNKAIIAEFNGKNHRELARKYGVSVQWIYSILNNGKKNAENWDFQSGETTRFKR